MTDGKTVFSGKEKKYDKNRPHYPEALMTFLYAEVGFRADSAIADIGIGTGIFSKQLSDRGSTVFCVEPNPDMRSIAEEKLSSYANVTFTDGDCKDTKLAAHSVDFITAAQAFHWFDVEAFRRESLRILKPKGRMVLVWNRRDETCAVHQRTAETLRKYCPEFHGHGGGPKDEEGIARYFGGAFDYREFRNDVFYDRDGFIGRNLSASYAPREGEKSYGALTDALSEIFDAFSFDGRILLPHITAVYWGRL